MASSFVFDATALYFASASLVTSSMAVSLALDVSSMFGDSVVNSTPNLSMRSRRD